MKFHPNLFGVFEFVQAVRQAVTNGSMFLTSVVNVSTTIYHSFKSLLLRRFDAFSGHGLPDHFPPSFFLPCCSLPLPYRQQIYKNPTPVGFPKRLLPPERPPTFLRIRESAVFTVCPDPSGVKTLTVSHRHTIGRSHCI
jgi:hypothetical protein